LLARLGYVDASSANGFSRSVNMFDWAAIEGDIGTREGDPEAILHELAHAYDLTG
jgi:hypothetical protein